MTTNKQSGNYFAKVSFFSLVFVFFTITNIFAQANSIKSGATFNWADTQSNDDNPATIESIEINGTNYTTFIVPSAYNLLSVGPGGHGDNGITKNGTEILDTSNDPTWTTEALKAYQSLNLNHYF